MIHWKGMSGMLDGNSLEWHATHAGGVTHRTGMRSMSCNILLLVCRTCRECRAYRARHDDRACRAVLSDKRDTYLSSRHVTTFS